MLHRRISRRLAVVAVGGVVLAVGVGAAVLASENPYDEPQTEQSLPPPAYSTWINPEGRFHVFEYDDRHMSEADKARDPVVNPRWAPFAECMEDRGQRVVDGSPEEMRQADIDALVDRLNEEYPDIEANRQIGSAADTSGLAADFLACADEWLNLDQQEFEERLRQQQQP